MNVVVKMQQLLVFNVRSIKNKKLCAFQMHMHHLPGVADT
jgi:hypothetical protein